MRGVIRCLDWKKGKGWVFVVVVGFFHHKYSQAVEKRLPWEAAQPLSLDVKTRLNNLITWPDIIIDLLEAGDWTRDLQLDLCCVLMAEAKWAQQ